MCRLLGIVAREPRGFQRCLREERRSLAALGREHSDGWGIAVHDAKEGWTLTKQCTSASSDPAFDAAVSDATGALLIAHVRKRTVGGVTFENTHPFRHKEWVFAHNGTIECVAALRAAIAPGAAMPKGDTDSELLFAFLMSRLASQGAKRSPIIAHMVLARAVEDLAKVTPSGSVTFVLSDGSALYAYRHGPPLFLLERRSPDGLESILIASEPVTHGEVWAPVPERNLLTAWRRPSLGWAMMLETPPGPRLAVRRDAIRVAEGNGWSGGRSDGA
jgi:predicted glutamine amidotransferase